MNTISFKSILKNLSFSFFANMISLIVSTILIVIVPKFLDSINYGYWQLYLFYITYISYLSLGLTDGAYLRFGGKEYNELNKPVFVSQYWFLVLFDILASAFILIIYKFIVTDNNKELIFFLVCLSGIIVVPRSLITFILQATNRIREFSIIIIVERLVYFVIVIIMLFFGRKEFEYLIFADIIGKFSSVIYAIFLCKELVLGKLAPLKYSIIEIYHNISTGGKLLFANFANILIIGIVRFCIEKNWSIEVFGKVSLTLSISNMLMVFISSIGITLFPILKRVSTSNLADIYKLIRTGLMIILLGLMLLYYPLDIILSDWLPQYSDSFTFLILLFPICIYESKMLLLINNYLKTIRREGLIFLVNIFTIVISIGISYFSVFVLNNLNMSVFCILLLMMFRSIASELLLSKILSIKVTRDIIYELIMTIIFLIVSWYLEKLEALIIYLIIYVVYLVIKKTDIKYLLNNIKALVRS